MISAFKRWVAVALLAGIAVMMPSIAQAVVLTPPMSSGTPTSDNGTNPGTLLASTTSSQAFHGMFGTVWAAVFLNGAGTLDFYYQVLNGAGSPSNMNRVSHSSFASAGTDVYYRTDGATGFASLPGFFTDGGILPQLLGLQTDAANRDDGTIGFSYSAAGNLGALAKGSRTAVMVIKTDATTYGSGITSAINGGAINFSTFAVPEPGTLALLGLAFLGAGLRARRRT